MAAERKQKERPGGTGWMQKREQWLSLVNDLVEDISAWCQELGWSVARNRKRISEEKVGEYEVPCLTVQTPHGQIHVDPVGVDIVGANGRVDILAFPSLNRLLLVRLNGQWKLLTDSRVPWPEKWSKKTFANVVESLAA